MPPPEVAVATVTSGDLPILLEYTGRAVGSRDVEVRARVSGILLERRYEEGSAVRKGDVLFRSIRSSIVPPPRRRGRSSGVADARLNEARRQRDRIVPLFEKNAASQRQRDEAVSAYEVAAANVEAAKARLRAAQLDLGYTSVRAPISGLTSRGSPLRRKPRHGRRGQQPADAYRADRSDGRRVHDSGSRRRAGACRGPRGRARQADARRCVRSRHQRRA